MGLPKQGGLGFRGFRVVGGRGIKLLITMEVPLPIFVVYWGVWKLPLRFWGFRVWGVGSEASWDLGTHGFLASQMNNPEP